MTLLDSLMAKKQDKTTKVKVDSVKGLTITLKALTPNEIKDLRQRATYPGEKGKEVVNETELNELLVNASIVGPKELFDEEVLKANEVKNVGELLASRLTIGEYQHLMQEFTKINGLNDKEIEDAKN